VTETSSVLNLNFATLLGSTRLQAGKSRIWTLATFWVECRKANGKERSARDPAGNGVIRNAMVLGLPTTQKHEQVQVYFFSALPASPGLEALCDAGTFSIDGRSYTSLPMTNPTAKPIANMKAPMIRSMAPHRR
jgi:hypothetical protein